jgi:hypothetical protein
MRSAQEPAEVAPLLQRELADKAGVDRVTVQRAEIATAPSRRSVMPGLACDLFSNL